MYPRECARRRVSNARARARGRRPRLIVAHESRYASHRTSTGFVVIHVHAFELQIGITDVRPIATDAVFVANHLRENDFASVAKRARVVIARASPTASRDRLSVAIRIRESPRARRKTRARVPPKTLHRFGSRIVRLECARFHCARDERARDTARVRRGAFERSSASIHIPHPSRASIARDVKKRARGRENTVVVVVVVARTASSQIVVRVVVCRDRRARARRCASSPDGVIHES